MTIEERLWAKVVKAESGCWEFIGAMTKRKNGYGMLKVGSRQRVLAHRLSWELHNRRLEPDEKVLHRCDNPKCVNPEHLFVGTQLDNVKDMIAKGRMRYRPKPHPLPGKARGERVATAKLDAVKVLQIASDPRTGIEIAKEYGISNQQVSNIKSRKAWRHLFSTEEE